jgi:hypothetical protein
MKYIRTQDVVVNTTGSDSSATGSGVSTPMTGELLDLYILSNTDADTMDTTISESTFGTIMVVTDSHASGRFAPRMPVHTAAAAAITNGYDRYPLKDSVITISCAQANVDAPALTVTIRWATDM